MPELDRLFDNDAALDEPEIATDKGHKLPIENALKFMIAGKAIFTIKSLRTGTHFTFKVDRCAEKGKEHMHFVSVLTGPDNTDWRLYKNFALIFTDHAQPKLVFTRAPKIALDSPSVKAFAWTWEKLQFGFGHRDLEIWHAGACGRCGRMLTHPTSIASGFGPECIGKVGL